MIFHDSVIDGHHMMDWDMSHWIPMIFGWGIVLLAIFILLYFVIQSTLSIKSKGQMNIPIQKSKKKEVEAFKDLQYEQTNEKSNFCYSCGGKLDRNINIEYCPNCGVKV